MFRADRRRFSPVIAAIAALALVAVSIVGCDPEEGAVADNDAAAELKQQREQMVARQIAARGVRDDRVLASLREVPRHLFVPAEHRSAAYADTPLPIGENQTISQPYIVALMTELLEVGPGSRVLEIGTGSGYQAAVLGAMGVEVFTIEIRSGLCESARRVLAEQGYDTVHVRCGDGYGGWPEEAPFDGIIVTAAPERIPDPLIEQLREGAHMVIPVGSFYQELKVITRTVDGVEERSVIPVRFVPMTGEIERQP